ncbi:Protein PLASTID TRANSCRIPTIONALLY ACTIVE 10 [Ancistrocladus abbreviatus]
MLSLEHTMLSLQLNAHQFPALSSPSFTSSSTKPYFKPCKSRKTNLPFSPPVPIFSLLFISIAKRIPRQKFFTVPPKLSYSSDEFPVDETFLEQFGPKEKESEEEARRRNWIERGWAPWEEILTPEADFARKSLNEGEEVPLKSPEAIEAFKMLKPSYRKKKMEEMGLTEDEYYAKQFEIKGEILEPLQTMWDGPLVVRHVAPRDWPPRGWEVDREELEFIREGHKMMAERVDVDTLERADGETEGMCLDRYKMFLKQYQEWVEQNKDRLEEESYKYDQDYHPGRRKRGEDYEEGMYELPFYYPGQICIGKVTTLHLYQGAFVDIGGVYEGWVPIKGNDWYWIRQHIKVGMQVIVEILAKRDPYRFRFPIEMRFVDPNIDHLIFNRFEFPPIFHRAEDTNPDELRRDCGRPPLPRKDPGTKIEEEPLFSDHPYVEKLWQIHVAEQMILDDMEANPDKYKGKKLSELTDDEEFDEENSVEYTTAYYKKTQIPKVILKTSVRELDLEAALAERELNNRLQKEAEERGEEYKVTKLRRNIEMDEYDLIHWRRSFEEREALIRDISCRQALGLPLEEPGRYVDASAFGKDQYDPSNPLYRYDYWGEPENSEKSKQERMTDAHNKSIVGKGTVWYEMSYEDAIKQRMQREARSKGVLQQDFDEEDRDDPEECGDEDADSEEDDFDYSILSDASVEYGSQPHVNGTESSRMSDEGMFED